MVPPSGSEEERRAGVLTLHRDKGGRPDRLRRSISGECCHFSPAPEPHYGGAFSGSFPTGGPRGIWLRYYSYGLGLAPIGANANVRPVSAGLSL